MYPLSDSIIANSKWNGRDLIERFKIDEQQINVIENPFDIQKIHNLSDEAISYSFENKFIFISVGRLESHKRHSLIIEAFAKLERHDIELWIIGIGP